ncbi:fumarylacetoacetate hydrolase family protein [Bacillus chungangensis]|uniref:2-keto-4-pentenoate hydratase/2-oxohepta-3-ene-1,7-dioic acid hydratase in catechol pathway n=1 Tax=Bacillus chungangensis TaxID=587633 RepID=A0ABT9WNK7_9BACI|nr:fumarylacetoacetate hydrolase family protein [Bacillus chungangensis]MDQ0174824.1 2-keto-4-pentenoate hydratase/2-oxohepta-3-ene-1,7-dioic acid hydratase in catechol pathway [Bacillus chungangensis]
MKLVTFQTKNSTEMMFGFVFRQKYVISFHTMILKTGNPIHCLHNMNLYLHHLPMSHQYAEELYSYADDFFENINQDDIHCIHDVRLLPPIPSVPALLDFGLSPRHLKNSAINMVQKEYTWPLNVILKAFMARKLRGEHAKPNFRYYKCNHNAIIGNGDTIHWPSFTSYLDIEPELAIVIGKDSTIAGYTIFNDSSARDVQIADFLSLTGPAKSKDFNASKGIGPYLVTPDEIDDPLKLEVKVRIGNRLHWKGSTSEYTAHPLDVVDFVRSIFTPLPGTIIGMGTIPDCCAIETDEWLLPSDQIEISFSKLGTLTQYIPDCIEIKNKSRWPNRVDLISTKKREEIGSCP